MNHSTHGDLHLPYCRRCGQEQQEYTIVAGKTVASPSPCRCSPIWTLNPEHPEAEIREAAIRKERKRAGLCLHCSSGVSGVVGRAQFCDSCREDSRTEAARRHTAQPKRKRAMAKAQRTRRRDALASQEEKLRYDRKQAGLCVLCPNKVDGVVGKTLYCADCRKKVQTKKDRDLQTRPEVKSRRRKAARTRHQKRMQSDPEYQKAYRDRRQKEIPLEGTPEREAYLAYQAEYNSNRREQKLEYAKKYNRFQDGQAPTCAHCASEVPWSGVGKPKKYCPDHEPIHLHCRGCRKVIRWVPQPGERPLYHGDLCRKLAERREREKNTAPSADRTCACACGRSLTGLRGQPKRHPDCVERERASSDQTIRALFAQGRGPGHMASQTRLPLAQIRRDLERLGLVRSGEDHVYMCAEWWHTRLIEQQMPAWQAIAEAGLSKQAAQVDVILTRFGLLEAARPTRGKPIRFPELQDPAFVRQLLRQHAGSFKNAAAAIGCQADRVSLAAHQFGIVTERRPAPTVHDSEPRFSWAERIAAGATLLDLQDETGLDSDAILENLKHRGLEDQLWINVTQRERQNRSAR